MIASDDVELEDWIFGIRASKPSTPGGFLFSIAEAAVRADSENYPLLRPVLLQLAKKYPAYSYKGGIRG